MTRTVRHTVVITRAAEQGSGWVERITAAGYHVLEVPVIRIVDPVDGGRELGDALAHLDQYDWLVVTSANGAARVRDAWHALAPAARPRLAAVGRATADALGGPVDIVATNSSGEGLVEVMPRGAGRVLLTQAEAARDVVRSGLAALGWSVDAVTAYRTVAAPVAPDVVQAAASADAVVFTSGSTVREFVAAAGRAAVPPIVVSIGPSTTAVADGLGVKVSVTAQQHNLDGVVSALRSVLPPATD